MEGWSAGSHPSLHKSITHRSVKTSNAPITLDPECLQKWTEPPNLYLWELRACALQTDIHEQQDSPLWSFLRWELPSFFPEVLSSSASLFPNTTLYQVLNVCYSSLVASPGHGQQPWRVSIVLMFSGEAQARWEPVEHSCKAGLPQHRWCSAAWISLSWVYTHVSFSISMHFKHYITLKVIRKPILQHYPQQDRQSI